MNRFSAILLYLLAVNLYAQNKADIDSINNIPFESKIKDAARLDAVFLKNAANAKKIKYPEGEANSYSNLGLVYYYQGKYESNVGYILKAIKIYEAIGATEKQASEYGGLGYSMKRRNMTKALYYMQKGKYLAETNKLTDPLLSIYNNYGVLKEMTNELDSALWYYKKGLTLNESINDSVGIPYSLNNIAGNYVIKKNYGAAKSLYEKALKIRLFRKDEIGIAENYTYFGDLFFAQKAYRKALEYYRLSLNRSLQYQYTYLIGSNYQSVSRCYELMNNAPEALLNFKKYTQYKDSLLNKETNAKIAELEIQFETSKKEKLLAQNKNMLLQKEVESRQKNIVLMAISVLALFLVCIGYLILRQQRLKNTQLAKEHELKTAISQIETQNKLQEQRLSISRDLHDNIGAQLTFIISAVDNIKYSFNVQNPSLDTKLENISSFAKSTIVELRDTIWAMNSNEITFEDLRARIMNFIDKAKEAMQSVSFKFNLNDDFDTVKFTSIAGMNIYRTIQEAVNNALKYAEASEISIDVSAIGSEIKIAITDNGIGFNKTAIEKGNGLLNMEKRIEDIGGIFNLASEVNNGTVVTLLLKIKQNSI